MKIGVAILVLVGLVGVYLMYFTESAIDKSFDPDEQGRAARGAVAAGDTWLAVLDSAGEPKHWREGSNEYDFGTAFLWNEWNDATRDDIEARIRRGDLSSGFCFLYKFSDAYTFALNFDGQGAVMNIQDKESKAQLLDKEGD